MSSAGTAFFEADGLGSITSLSGMIGLTDTYNAFGVTTPTGTNPNRFRYTGREWDSETGLYYYRARYYDPAIGRFVSEDPVHFAGGSNFYRYVRNNPVLRIDPTGLIHQAWNEPPFDGRLHDDPGAGLEVLCTKGRNKQQDIKWLELSIYVRGVESEALGDDADTGHIDRLDAEIATLKRCKQCDDKKPEPGSAWDDITNWLHDRWLEFSYYMSHPHHPQPIGPPPLPPPYWAPI